MLANMFLYLFLKTGFFVRGILTARENGHFLHNREGHSDSFSPLLTNFLIFIALKCKNNRDGKRNFHISSLMLSWFHLRQSGNDPLCFFFQKFMGTSHSNISNCPICINGEDSTHPPLDTHFLGLWGITEILTD